MKFSRKPGMQEIDEAAASAGDADIRSAFTQGTQRARAKSQRASSSKRGYLDGQMLIAMPSMGDERFARSVIYVCAHSSEGAMGIIVNQPAAQHQLPRPPGAARCDSGRGPDPASAARRRGEGAQGRAGRYPARLRPAFEPTSSSRTRRCRSTKASASPPRSTSSRRSRAATGRAARSWRSAMPAGRPASSRTRSSITAGCIARPIPS